MAKRIRTALIGSFGIAAILMVLAFGVKADDQRMNTIMTLDGPIEIPGYYTWHDGLSRETIVNDVLPKDIYMLRLVDLSPSLQSVAPERLIFRITSLDGKRASATLMAIPEFERNPAQDELTFFEIGKRLPALHGWHRGGKPGFAFVYPKEQALEIAQNNGVYVIAAEESASGPWIALEERIRGLLEQPLVLIYPDGTEIPLPERDTAAVGSTRGSSLARSD